MSTETLDAKATSLQFNALRQTYPSLAERYRELSSDGIDLATNYGTPYIVQFAAAPIFRLLDNADELAMLYDLYQEMAVAVGGDRNLLITAIMRRKIVESLTEAWAMAGFLENLMLPPANELPDDADGIEIDTWLDDPMRIRADIQQGRQNVPYAHFALWQMRLPAWVKSLHAPVMKDIRLFVDIDNVRHRVVGASRMGDLTVTTDLGYSPNYTRRILISDPLLGEWYRSATGD